MPIEISTAARLSTASLPDAVRHSWLIAAFGALVLYLPSYWQAAHGLWQSEESGHAPLILLVSAFLMWRLRDQIALVAEPAPVAGSILLGVALLVYLGGRVLGISSVEFASQVPLVAAVLMLLHGPRALRVAWFPILYLIFMVPLPGSLVDALTGPLKHWISIIVVESLHAVGYPIARTGVIISVASYQLLVADACSGLNSMFSLAALGTLYMYIVPSSSRARNLVMLLSIIPIAFTANIVRVITLVLVTYHFGDEAGQGFLHGAAGIGLMLVALCLFFALDRTLAWMRPSRRNRR